jgi:hypothetical protein
VRLAAAKAMRVVIDDFEFSVEELEPYLNQVWLYFLRDYFKGLETLSMELFHLSYLRNKL